APLDVVTTGFTYTDSVSVTLTGSINTHGQPATYAFYYSTDSTFATYSVTGNIAIQNNTFANVQQYINNLSPNTRYYYFLKTQSFYGEQHGSTLSFFTGNSFQSLITNAAVNITSSSATLTGTVEGFTFPVNLNFEYGT